MSVLITTHFRPVENIRSFSRETVVEITCNVESQEYRRCEIIDIGYLEQWRTLHEILGGGGECQGPRKIYMSIPW